MKGCFYSLLKLIAVSCGCLFVVHSCLNATENGRSQSRPTLPPATNSSSVAEQVKVEKPPIRPRNLSVLDAVDLIAIYDQNEVAADAECDGKLFAVNGVIRQIGKDILGDPYVALSGPKSGIFGVQCMFSDADSPALAKLLPGQKIKIAGVGGGKLGNVLMRECWIYGQ